MTLSSEGEIFNAGCSFQLVEHAVEHGECLLGDEVTRKSAELIGEVLDVVQRSDELAGKTR